MRLRKQVTIKFFLASWLLSAAASLMAKEPPKILASIKPVQLIAQAVTEGVTSVDVLLPPGASPHSHSLKPSDARKLRDADVVFWIGPDMEMFLEKMLAGSKQTISVAMMEASQLKLMSRSSEEHHHHHEAGHGHEHHGDYDAHIWLSPTNALAMAETMVNTLSKLDKPNQKRYQENLEKFRKEIHQANLRNRALLSPVQKRPFFVFHDAYGYLQDHYQLNVAGHFTLNPEQQPGARHLAQLREKLRSAGNTCVFREPQFQPAYIDRLTDGLDAKVEVLDPLAMDVSEGASSYVRFINSLVDTISSCLG